MLCCMNYAILKLTRELDRNPWTRQCHASPAKKEKKWNIHDADKEQRDLFRFQR